MFSRSACIYLPLYVFLDNFALSHQQFLSSYSDLKTLSELPLNKLLEVQNSFLPKDFDEDKDEPMGREIPEALPLKAEDKNYKKGSSEEYYPPKKGDKKDIQKILQLSVTTLSFLAFGGYLLCLIVQAIKAKNNYYYIPPSTTTTTTTTAATFLNRPDIRRPLNKRRPHKIRLPHKIKPKRPQRRPKPRNKREISGEFEMEDMYETLLTIAEGYTKFHTVNYKYLNSSFLNF